MSSPTLWQPALRFQDVSRMDKVIVRLQGKALPFDLSEAACVDEESVRATVRSRQVDPRVGLPLAAQAAAAIHHSAPFMTPANSPTRLRLLFVSPRHLT